MNKNDFYDIMKLIYSDKNKAKIAIAKNKDLLELRNSVKETPLHYFAIENLTNEVMFLIKEGAAIDTFDMSRVTPLMHAIILGYDELALALIELGANINHQDINGDTPLHCAAKYGRIQIIEKLISMRVNVVKNNCDEKPTDVALSRKNAQIIELLTAN